MIPYLRSTPDPVFPSVETAHECGIVAAGGRLNARWLEAAYSRGIFPWFNEDEPVVWWSPDPRFVLYLDELRISGSMRRIRRKNPFEVTFDRDFRLVMEHCSTSRGRAETGTWISDDMIAAYCELFEAGSAHSVEVRFEGKLVGGLYGVMFGRYFSGESMFSLVSNSSKLALIHLVERLKAFGVSFIDCQVHSDHLESMGAVEIPRNRFLAEHAEAFAGPPVRGRWVCDD